MTFDLVRKQRTSPPTGPKRRVVLWIGIAALTIATLGIAAGPMMSRVEQPEYTTAASNGALEIREYSAMIVAEAEVKGERKTAIREGFRIIAAYIFGENKKQTNVDMTAPVQQQQSIAMTAPVRQEAKGDTWTVSFVMPKSWTMATLPEPNDPRVTLKPVEAKRFAAIRFSGSATDEQVKEKTNELRRYAQDQKLQTVGEPVMAFYNPPWTLPFLRRNEVLIELAALGA